MIRQTLEQIKSMKLLKLKTISVSIICFLEFLIDISKAISFLEDHEYEENEILVISNKLNKDAFYNFN